MTMTYEFLFWVNVALALAAFGLAFMFSKYGYLVGTVLNGCVALYIYLNVPFTQIIMFGK